MSNLTYFVMYRPNSKSVDVEVCTSPKVERFERSAYKSFSYYALGGSDPSGDHLNMTAQVTYDSPDDVNDSGSSPNVFSEHRATAMDVAEVLGTMDVEDIREKEEKKDDDKK